MKKKVLFFVNSYAGGAEKMTLNIASYLDAEIYEVKFYIVGKNWDSIKKFIPAEYSIKHLNNRFSLFEILKVLKKDKPQIVFSSLMPINWRLCLISYLFPKVKVIIRVNNYLYTQALLQKIRLFLTYRRANKVIVQTDEMRYEHLNILKLPNSSVITLSNPVNTRLIDSKIVKSKSPFNHDYVNYVYAGRIDPVKGLDILIESFNKVLNVQKHSRLYLIGEIGGGFKKYYEELLHKVNLLGISQSVFFMGFSDNPYKYMKYADCFVLPSRNEGLPNVLIEALYLGTPVAVTDSVPVIQRIVSQGKNGYISEVDDIGGLFEIMIKSSKLGRIQSEYKSASEKDFINLFQ